ncbi:MAG: HD domain-containing protein [Prevotellaceae bacterium]|nr:HD domain-containing protein [Prevotellaceae bacterium]
MNTLNLEIVSFVETQILPRYAAFGKSHGIAHVQRVIANSIELARIVGADVNMAYVIAAYHDLGMSGERAIHHIIGGKILFTDARLKKWFSPERLTIMREAIEDHRASASRQPRSIYGKIVAEADRDLDTEVIFRRAIQFGLERYPEKDKEAQWERFRQHMQEKYARGGYVRLWIPNSPNRLHLMEIQAIIDNPLLLRQWFDRLYTEEKEETHL